MKEQRCQKSNNDANELVWGLNRITWSQDRKSTISSLIYNDYFSFLVFSSLIFFSISFLFLLEISFLPIGLISIVISLLLLTIYRLLIGYISYKDFIKVEAKCIDREIKNIDGPIPDTGFIKIAKWAPRVLCEYTYEGDKYKVTPIIPYYGTFLTRRKVEVFLNDRIEQSSNCVLWINPKNRLHTLFHSKPLTICKE